MLSCPDSILTAARLTNLIHFKDAAVLTGKIQELSWDYRDLIMGLSQSLDCCCR